MVKHDMILDWKEHNVDLPAFVAWAKAQDANCCGASSDVNLRLHFLEVPSQEIQDAINAQWEAMDDAEHAMCESYNSQADIDAAKVVLKASANAKLKALGLTDAEIAAMNG